MPETRHEKPDRITRGGIDRPLPKRFYKEASVGPDNSILLDGRAVKTPLKRPLLVPNRALAHAIALEWSEQVDVINPAVMPLVKLSNTAVDRAGPEREYVQGEVEAYAASDLVLYRAETPAELVNLQALHWDPVLVWTVRELHANFKSTPGIVHVPQPAASLDALRRAISRLHDFELTALHNLTTLTGSALLSLMILNRAISADAAWEAAHVDEDFEISQWGEDGEAVRRRENRRADFDATLRFLNLLQENS